MVLEIDWWRFVSIHHMEELPPEAPHQALVVAVCSGALVEYIPSTEQATAFPWIDLASAGLSVQASREDPQARTSS